MQVMIEIPDSQYEYLAKISDAGEEPLGYFERTIMRGTIIPKGHGRIGDLDKILIWMIYKKGIIDKLKCGEVTPIFEDATIIEADKGE